MPGLVLQPLGRSSAGTLFTSHLPGTTILYDTHTPPHSTVMSIPGKSPSGMVSVTGVMPAVAGGGTLPADGSSTVTSWPLAQMHAATRGPSFCFGHSAI